jgi:GTP cyclohydrolase IA
MIDMNELIVNSSNIPEAARTGRAPSPLARRRFPLRPVPAVPSSPIVIDEAPWLPPAFDEKRVADAVREILAAIGEDPDRDGLKDTPARVARAYREIFAGMRQEASDHLGRVFEHDGEELVTVRDIQFYSVCEHHLLPFFGRAHVAYLPGTGRVVGLSKIARTVEVFARRPQIQERLTAQIADAIADHLGARGVSVVIDAEHLCMKMRGARSGQSSMTTFAHRGTCAEVAQVRHEALAALGRSGSYGTPAGAP